MCVPVRAKPLPTSRMASGSLVIPGNAKCEEVSVQLRPVEGKNRLEGEFRSGMKGGTIYFEWK